MELIKFISPRNRRLMDERYSEFFQDIDLCRYSLKNTMKNKKLLDHSSSNIKIRKEIRDVKRNPVGTKRPQTSNNIHKSKMSNAYSFDQSENAKLDESNPSDSSYYLSNKLKSKDSSSKRSLSHVQTQNMILQSYLKKGNKVSQIFKDMSLRQLMRHQRGLINYVENEKAEISCLDPTKKEYESLFHETPSFYE